MTELEGEIVDAQEDCRRGVHGQCARIPGLRRALAKAKSDLDLCLFPRTLTVVQPGAQKAKPYTIVILANPALEKSTGSGVFAVDPIVGNPAAFQASVTYIRDNLLGTLAGQRETFLAAAAIGPNIRIVSLLVRNLPANAATSLVGENATSNIIDPRRSAFLPFLQRFGLGDADVVYAVTASPTHTRASAFGTTDDDSQGGVSFTLDGTTLSHRFFPKIPGTIAISTTSGSLTAIHEFGHAASSYNNGFVTDMYVDTIASPPTINVKDRAKPTDAIPVNFATYSGTTYPSDQNRDSLGYPPTWVSYHSALVDATVPGVMDNFFTVPVGRASTDCRHDRITRQFLTDRITAKLSR